VKRGRVGTGGKRGSGNGGVFSGKVGGCHKFRRGGGGDGPGGIHRRGVTLKSGKVERCGGRKVLEGRMERRGLPGE